MTIWRLYATFFLFTSKLSRRKYIFTAAIWIYLFVNFCSLVTGPAQSNPIAPSCGGYSTVLSMEMCLVAQRKCADKIKSIYKWNAGCQWNISENEEKQKIRIQLIEVRFVVRLSVESVVGVDWRFIVYWSHQIKCSVIQNAYQLVEIYVELCLFVFVVPNEWMNELRWFEFCHRLNRCRAYRT